MSRTISTTGIESNSWSPAPTTTASSRLRGIFASGQERGKGQEGAHEEDHCRLMDEPQVPDGVEVVGMVSRQGHDQSEHRSRHGAAQAQSCPQRTPNQASAATERPVEAMNPERTM